MKPLARSNQLVVEKVGGETVVYDSDSKKAHNLNPVVGWIWSHCDGSMDIEALSAGVEKEFGSTNGRGVVLEALQQLEDASLLVSSSAPKAKMISRRAAAAGVGAALVPAVASIVVPRAAAAASTTPKKKKKKAKG